MSANFDLNTQALSFSRYKQLTFCAVAIVCVAITMMLGAHYRFHLLWIYTRYRLEMAVPITFESRKMPYVPIPPSWVKHNLGKIEFSLPPEFQISEANGVRLYQYETKSVRIWLPDESYDVSAIVNVASNIHSQHSIHTLPMLRYECYRTASTEFHWAMSPSDVRWYIFCVTWIKSFQTMRDRTAELLFNDKIDGFASIGRSMTVFEWECKKTSLGGYIYFHDGGETETNDTDNDWIRAICNSLNILDSCRDEK